MMMMAVVVTVLMVVYLPMTRTGPSSFSATATLGGTPHFQPDGLHRKVPC